MYGNDLHPSTGEDDEDDGGVAEDGGERDRAVEQGDHYHLAQLVKCDYSDDHDDGITYQFCVH